MTSQTLNSRPLPTGHYGYSATTIDRLGATEYTLVTLAIDKSASVTDFRADIEDCVRRVIRACKQSPRADNLLVRVVMFGHRLEEFHGYKLLEDCHLDDYKRMLGRLGHSTVLFDAAGNAVAAANAYGRELTDEDYAVNSIVVVVTDGLDNASTFTPQEVGEQLAAATREEHVESMVSILVDVGLGDPGVTRALHRFQKQAGISQFVDVGNATPQTLAKLAEFVSRSISSQSQALGSGGPSRLLTF